MLLTSVQPPSSLSTTTAAPSNSSSTSELNDTHQIHSVLSDTLHRGPPYEQIDQANSTEDTISKVSTDARKTNEEDGESFLPSKFRQMDWSNWTPEMISFRDDFFATSYLYSFWSVKHYRNPSILSTFKRELNEQMMDLLNQIEERVHRTVGCSEAPRESKMNDLKILDALILHMPRPASSWNREPLQRRREEVSRILEEIDNRTFDQDTFCAELLEYDDEY